MSSTRRLLRDSSPSRLIYSKTGAVDLHLGANELFVAFSPKPSNEKCDNLCLAAHIDEAMFRYNESIKLD